MIGRDEHTYANPASLARTPTLKDITEARDRLVGRPANPEEWGLVTIGGIAVPIKSIEYDPGYRPPPPRPAPMRVSFSMSASIVCTRDAFGRVTTVATRFSAALQVQTPTSLRVQVVEHQELLEVGTW